MGSPCTTLEFRQKINTANIAPTSGTEYSSALMDILQNFHQNLRWSGWKIGEFFVKLNGPTMLQIIIFITQNTRPSIIFGADKDNSIWAALSNDGNYTAVSPIPHAHIIWPWKGPSKRKSFFFKFQMAIM